MVKIYVEHGPCFICFLKYHLALMKSIANDLWVLGEDEYGVEILNPLRCESMYSCTISSQLPEISKPFMYSVYDAVRF